MGCRCDESDARLTFVHDDFAYGEEFLGGERLGEEVRDIFVRFHEGNDYFVVLDQLADPEHLSVAIFMRLWCA